MMIKLLWILNRSQKIVTFTIRPFILEADLVKSRGYVFYDTLSAFR
jgi:hypothetical protein